MVAETCRSYGLPEEETFDGVPLVGAFELEGRLCFTIHKIIHDLPVGLNLWVMSPPPEDDNKPPQWDRRHRFYINEFYATKPWSAWADDGGKMLCYMHGNTLHKYDMWGRYLQNRCRVQWDQQLRLSEIPSVWNSLKCRWSIHGGYRLTLLSPLRPCTMAGA